MMLGNELDLIYACRSDGVVSDVRVRYRPLAAEGHRAHDWLRPV